MVGWLVGWLSKFSDFQRNLSFGSTLAERVVELRKKALLLSVLSFVITHRQETMSESILALTRK